MSSAAPMEPDRGQEARTERPESGGGVAAAPPLARPLDSEPAALRMAPPLPPVVLSPGWARVYAAMIFLGCAGLLGVAVWLRPDPRGHGTHQQLGMAPCGMMLLGLPCPTCGMTTAFAHTVRGHFLQAAWAQPTGLVLCLLTIVTSFVSLRSLVDRKSVV